MGNKKKIHVLRRRADFLMIQRKGFRVRPAEWLVLNYIPNNLGFLRLGWTIPKKVGNAVLRNKLKRWCREWGQKTAQQTEGRGFDINIVFVKNDPKFTKTIRFQQLRETLEQGVRSIYRRA